MMRAVLFFLLFCSFFLEITITSLPLLLLVFLFFWLLTRDPIVFPVAFITGIFFDLQRVGTLGVSSLFFVLFLGLVVLYERKFEIETLPFVFVSSAIGSAVFLFVLGYHHILEQALIMGCVALGVFWGLLHFNTKKTDNFQRV